MFTVSKNILVTGSSGFIGFNLSKRLLSEGHNVTGIDSFNEAYDPVSYTHLTLPTTPYV